jgi:membrane associated rhomboid family serine protease
MIGNVAVHLMAGKYLETIWGSKEFIKFICIINAASGAASFFVLLFLFFTTGNDLDWYAARHLSIMIRFHSRSSFLSPIKVP